jgi:AcrR family transcriptional regulator
MPGQKRSEQERQESILSAAYDVAARRGLSALSLRAVAKRAKVSHGTVLFHFRRRDQLLAALLDRVLYATTALRVPDEVKRLTRPADRMSTLLRYEMERLSSESRHFRLFLEYWTVGLRDAAVRSRLKIAVDAYRSAWGDVAGPVTSAARISSVSKAPAGRSRGLEADALAGVAVSLIHGCVLQALLDPPRFDILRHYEAASQMLMAVFMGTPPKAKALAGATGA